MREGGVGPAAQVRILALTTNADPWDAASYIFEGMNGVVEKPIKAERLLSAINAVFADGLGGWPPEVARVCGLGEGLRLRSGREGADGGLQGSAAG